MAQRTDTTTPAQPSQEPGTSSTKTVEERVVAFAEQLGRLVGTVQGKTDGWLDRTALKEQLTRVRDGAADLLDHIATASASAAASARKQATQPREHSSEPAAPGRSGGKVDAPGKKHRKPPASARGVKHSDETISKVKGAQTMRRGPRRG
jgi:hypothetical protein